VSCSVCAKGVVIDDSLSNVGWGDKLGVSENAVRRHLKHTARVSAAKPEEPVTLSGKAVFDSTGGEFTDVQTEAPLTDWSDIFARFNRDPAEFIIADDTVRMSTWQQSKGLEDGTRDVVNLYSYSARFTRKTVDATDVSGIIDSLRAWKPTGRTSNKPLGTPVTYFDGWADWQLGKGEGDGTKGTIQRVLDGFEKSEKRVKELRRQGINVAGLLIGNMGDHTEAVTGHYTSQTYSVDLNQRDQLNAAIELNLTGIKLLAPLFDEVTYMACLCNHGQWQRVAGKALTDDSDNSTGFIGDTLKTVCNLHSDLKHIDWAIPRDEMITTVNVSGVGVAGMHGHKMNGTEDNWLAKQAGYLRASRGFDLELAISAHRHTASIDDFGPYHRIQCTTQDPGSKSFTDATGKFSTQGTTTMLIGRHDKRKFSHYEVL